MHIIVDDTFENVLWVSIIFEVLFASLGETLSETFKIST